MELSSLALPNLLLKFQQAATGRNARERAILEVAAELEISERTPLHLIPQFADGRLLVAEGSTTNRVYYTPSKP